MTVCYIPPANMPQARLMPGLTLVAVASLQEYYQDMTGTIRLEREKSGDDAEPNKCWLCRGNWPVAKAMPSILPAMALEETLVITHLHSMASRHYGQIVTARPLRAPHHTASEVSILGGGQSPRPGEISLAHRGVCFWLSCQNKTVWR